MKFFSILFTSIFSQPIERDVYYENGKNNKYELIEKLWSKIL